MSDYDSNYPVVRIGGDDTVQIEVRRAAAGVFFYGELRKGTHADFIRWRQRSLSSSPTEWDVLDDMKKYGCPGKTIADLRRGMNATKALEAAKDFCSSSREDVLFLALLGEPGIGKSVAAGYAMREHGKRTQPNSRPTGDTTPEYLWIQAAQLVNASNYGEDALWCRDLERARFLVIDEIGADAASRASKAKVTELLLSRHAHNKPTVLTSNLSHADFAEVYGQAVVDRIRSSGIDPDLSKEKSLRERWQKPTSNPLP